MKTHKNKILMSMRHIRIRAILCMLLFSLGVSAQLRTVSGVVKDATGEPMIGVSVQLKNDAKVGTITNLDGAFTLSAPANSSLVFSYIGYVTQTLTGSQNMNVVMTEDNTKLDEVVVVGYGTVKKRDLTGAVTSVKSDDITMRPGPNPMEALQGKVAGLDITRESGQPGAELKMQLRGVRSFTADGNPLFLIDGLPGDYSTLNPNDIESIEVLKDASSTAIYGSAGANGVVIITTKAGKTGKLNVDFNTYVGFNGWSITPETRTGESYLQAKRDAYSYVWDKSASEWTTNGALWQSPADDERIFGAERYKLFQQGQFVDWAKLFLRDRATTQNYSLSVSGGNEKTKGYVSFNYADERGQYTGDDYQQYSTSMRIEHNVKKWLTIGSSLQASYVVHDKAQDKLENALVTDPLVKPYNDDGTLNWDLGNNVYNLLLDYQPGVYENQDNNFKINVNPFIEIKPIKGLTILSRAGIWLNYMDNYRFDGIGSVNYTYNGEIAEAKIKQNRKYGYQWDNVLTYNFKLLDVHDFTFTGVSTWYHNKIQETTMAQKNITSNNFKWHNMQDTDPNTSAKTLYKMSKSMGWIARLNYSYLGKYLFSASVRHDGASALYVDNRWDTFPAASVAWRISDEKFMDFSKGWLDNLKLRVGWGVTGTAKIDPYTSMNSLEYNSMSLGGQSQPIYRNSEYITNPELGWEKSYNTNIGLDVMLFNNRIDLTMDYYMTKTDGVIWNVPLPVIYGVFKPRKNYQTYKNLCETENRGFEFAANTRNITTRDFEWTSSLTFSASKEKINKLTDGSSNNITNGTTGYTLAVGEAVNSFFNYKLDGVWQLGEEKDAAVFNKRPGDLKVNVPNMRRVGEGVYVKTEKGKQTYYYTDLAEGQKYDSSLTAAKSTYAYSANDHQIVGKNSPDWTIGFQNGFKYKDFDLSIYAFVRWGQTIKYDMLGWYQPSSFATTASPSRTFPTHFNYWTPTNPSNDFPVMNYEESPSTMVGFSGLNYVDGSFFKLKNVTLGYTLPKKLGKKLSIEKLRIYGTMTNLFVLSKSDLLKDYDPEMNGSLEYPLTRQLVVGLNLTF